MRCSCGRPAQVRVENSETGEVYGYLCMDCSLKDDQARSLEFQRDMALLDMLGQQFNAVAGMDIAPRLRIPPPAPHIHTGAMMQNNIKVSNSTVGAINTGQIQNLKVALSDIRQSGDAATADAMTRFASAVLSANDANEAVKNELLEHLDCLAEQMAKAPSERSQSVMKTVLGGIKVVATTVGSLAKLYGPFEKYVLPYIRN